ncbi:MAG: hypothetical protein WC325_08270 [Candidatus Bathyarchaeia archaeon]|jgi:hypothetical protein
MLANIDSNTDQTKTSGNLKLTVTTSPERDVVDFNWKYSINGVDYNAIEILISDRSVCFSDTRNLFTIGDTTVNVTRDEAIDIATQYITTYSYTVTNRSVDGTPIKVEINDFKLRENAVLKAELSNTIRESNILSPCWIVELGLDGAYPGFIYGLSVSLWANTGEIIRCIQLGVGGFSTELPSESSTTTVLNTNVIVSITAIIMSIAVISAFFKKRRK